MSWRGRREGYVLWFGRDEQHSRAEALPPRITKGENGAKWLAPIDPVGGGTWLATRSNGLTVCLLNYYEEAGLLPSGTRSRGELVFAMVAEGSIEGIEAAWKEVALNDFAPFFLLAFEGPDQAVRWIWDGRELQREATLWEKGFLTTSSMDPSRVAATRAEAFRRIVCEQGNEEAAHEAFHRQFDPAHPAESVAMARDDARTVSLTRVEVTAAEIRLSYAARDRASLCFGEPVECSLVRFRHSR